MFYMIGSTVAEWSKASSHIREKINENKKISHVCLGPGQHLNIAGHKVFFKLYREFSGAKDFLLVKLFCGLLGSILKYSVLNPNAIKCN